VDSVVDDFTGFQGCSASTKLRLIFKGIPVPSQAIIFQRQKSLRLIYSIIIGQYISFPSFVFVPETFAPPGRGYVFWALFSVPWYVVTDWSPSFLLMVSMTQPNY
jgi:hypothetical protein